MYLVAIHRLIGAPELTTLLATFSVSLMIIGLGTAAFTTSQRAVEVNLGAIQAGAITILGASHLGVPVSTTHCINACIMGVGASKRVSAVRWGVAGNILTAWVLTIPLSAALSWVTMQLMERVFGA